MRAKSETPGRSQNAGSVFGNGNVEADRALARALKLAGIDRCTKAAPTSQRNHRPQTPQSVKQELDAAWDGARTARGEPPNILVVDHQPVESTSTSQAVGSNPNQVNLQEASASEEEHSLCGYEGQLVNNLAARALARAVQGPLSARAVIDGDRSVHEAIRQWQLYVHRIQVRDPAAVIVAQTTFTPPPRPASSSSAKVPFKMNPVNTKPQPIQQSAAQLLMCSHAEMNRTNPAVSETTGDGEEGAVAAGARLGLKARLLDELQFSRELACDDDGDDCNDDDGDHCNDDDGGDCNDEVDEPYQTVDGTEIDPAFHIPVMLGPSSDAPIQGRDILPSFSTGPLNRKMARCTPTRAMR